MTPTIMVAAMGRDGMRLSDVSKELNDLSTSIIGGALCVHKTFGPGLLESAYETCLAYELRSRGLDILTQLSLPVYYRGMKLEAGFRIDLLVNQVIVVEVKAVSKLAPVHDAQLLSYLKLGDYPLGLLFNFHEVRLTDGMRRLVNCAAAK